MNLLKQKLKNINPEALIIVFIIGLVIGWIANFRIMGKYAAIDCLLTKRQVDELIAREKYSGGPLSICLEFKGEELWKK